MQRSFGGRWTGRWPRLRWLQLLTAREGGAKEPCRVRGNLSTEASRGTADCYVARPARADSTPFSSTAPVAPCGRCCEAGWTVNVRRPRRPRRTHPCARRAAAGAECGPGAADRTCAGCSRPSRHRRPQRGERTLYLEFGPGEVRCRIIAGEPEAYLTRPPRGRPARAGFYAAPRNAPKPLEGSSSRWQTSSAPAASAAPDSGTSVCARRATPSDRLRTGGRGSSRCRSPSRVARACKLGGTSRRTPLDGPGTAQRATTWVGQTASQRAHHVIEHEPVKYRQRNSSVKRCGFWWITPDYRTLSSIFFSG